MKEKQCTCLPLPEPLNGLCPRHGIESVQKRLSPDAELTKLKSDVERLRAALKPFADLGECLENKGLIDKVVPHSYGTAPDLKVIAITVGDCRNAARALEETK